MRINLYVYNAAITALAKAAKQSSKRRNNSNKHKEQESLSLRALDLLEQMKADRIRPDGFSFSSAISCCGAEGKWEEALGLMDLMKKGGPRTQPNKIAYTAAIGELYAKRPLSVSTSASAICVCSSKHNIW